MWIAHLYLQANAPYEEQTESLPALTRVSGEKMGEKLQEYYQVQADLASHAELYRDWRLGWMLGVYKAGDVVQGHVSPQQFEHFPKVKKGS